MPTQEAMNTYLKSKDYNLDFKDDVSDAEKYELRKSIFDFLKAEDLAKEEDIAKTTAKIAKLEAFADPKDIGLSIESPTQTVVQEWSDVLTHDKHKDDDWKGITSLQRRFIAHVKARKGFEKWTDEEFGKGVIGPIVDRTQQDKRVSYDYMNALTFTEKMSLHLYREGMKFPFGLSSALAETLHPRKPSWYYQRMYGFGPTVDPEELSVSEAHKIVMSETEKRIAELPIISGERLLGGTAPAVARLTAEFLLLGKAGVPLKMKGLTEAHPTVAAALKSAQLLGAHEAVTITGWSEPEKKAIDVLQSAGIGMFMGSLKTVLPSPIMRMGAVTGALGAKAFIQTKVMGGDTEQALRSTFNVIETLVAMDLAGKIQSKVRYNKALSMQRDRIAVVYRKQMPGISNNEARMHADALMAGMKINALERTSRILLRPFIKLQKEGKLTPAEEIKMKDIASRYTKEGKEAQAKIDAAETYIVKKTISKFPGKVKDQASLEAVGNTIAESFGVKGTNLKWRFRHGVSPTKGGNIKGMQGTDPDGNNVIVIYTATRNDGKLSQGHIKKTMVHELGHIAKKSYMTPGDREMVHFPAFKKWVANAEGKLVEVKDVEIPMSTKLQLERTALGRKLRQKIHIDSNKMKLSTDEIKAIMYDATDGREMRNLRYLSNHELAKVGLSIKAMTSEEGIIAAETRIGLTNNEAKVIRRAAKTIENYSQLLAGYSDKSLPKDVTLRKEITDGMRLNARAQRLYKTVSGWDLFKHDSKLAFFNPSNWMSTRYFLDYISRITGKPIADYAKKAEEAFNLGRHEWSMYGNALLKDLGHEMPLLNMSRDSKRRVNRYLFYRTATDREALSAKELKLADRIAQDLDTGGQIATWMRGTRWYRWNSALSKVEGKITNELAKTKPNKAKIKGWQNYVKKFMPPDVTKKGSEYDAAKIITEGRNALKDGTFDKWIASQKWGTVQQYFMSGDAWDALATDTVELLKAPSMEIYEEVIKKKGIDYTALYPRKSGARPDLDANPYLRTKQHAYKAATMYRMYQDFEKFNNQLIAVDKTLHKQDRAILETYRDVLAGKHQVLGAGTKAMMDLNRLWWNGYSMQPTRFLWFGYRNLWQNLGMLPGQVSPLEFGKAALKIAKDGRSPAAINDFKEWWSTSVTQKRAMWETIMMSDPGERAKVPGIWKLLRVGEQIIPISDELNRKIAFWPIHQLVSDNLAAYRQGKISSDKLLRRLKIRTMAQGQKDRLIGLLSSNNNKEFIKQYTTEKVRNIHFVYDKFGRSILELQAANRPIIGLATWPRGAFEPYYHNAVKPIVSGIYNKNPKQVYEGIKNITGAIVGMTLAREGMRRTLGTKGLTEPYGAIGAMQYSPFSPGLGWFKASWDISKGMAIMYAQGKSPTETADYLLKSVSRQVEYIIPLVDVLTITYSKVNNKKGVRFYHALKEVLTRYDIRTDNLLKDNYQGLVDKWLTGVVGTEERGAKKEF